VVNPILTKWINREISHEGIRDIHINNPAN